jgi:curli biogenesis system outer membrane secretion channel CsgG
MRKIYYFFLAIYLLTSCAAYYNQPLGVERAIIGESTPATSLLKSLPKPKEQVVIGVYKFRDQTGQYKASEVGSTFSTAVTQGATSILLKALEDSKWFIPIERENIGNLLQERNLIRSTRQEYSKNTNEPQLTPLLYAGVLLEGGIVSYDSNIITGGFGARYFGAGGSTKYRQDRVTIYLRMISTSNGKILKSVYVSKTLFSQAIDQSFFRYVKFKRLLEVETGYTTNEPVQMAITEAIEKAVQSLVIEGIKDKIWMSDASSEEIETLLKDYAVEESIADSTALYNRKLIYNRTGFGLDLNGGVSRIEGDYLDPLFRPTFGAGLKFFFNPTIDLSLSMNWTQFASKNRPNYDYITFNLNTEVYILPKDKLSPFIYGGLGTALTRNNANSFLKFQYGVGLEYLATKNIGVKVFGEHNIAFSDMVDYYEAGKRDDYYYRLGLGLTFYFK